MKIKTSELQDAALDWAVIICNGWREDFRKYGFALGDGDSKYSPSTNWAQGGPITDRVGIIAQKSGDEFYSWLESDPEGDRNPRASGKTRLEAAMRCYVQSKLGDEVDVPDELLN